MLVVHGIPNCDACRGALAWLRAEGRAHRFHDVRADGLDGAALARWIGAVGWEALLNRRGATWRGLGGAEKADLDAARAAALMTAHPTLIKRPVIVDGDVVMVGFGERERAALKA